MKSAFIVKKLYYKNCILVKNFSLKKFTIKCTKNFPKFMSCVSIHDQKLVV